MDNIENIDDNNNHSGGKLRKKCKKEIIPGDCCCKKESKYNKMEVFIERWSSNMLAREEYMRAKAEMYKAQNSCSNICSHGSDASIGPTVGNPTNPSIKEYIDILETMEEVSTSSYNNALKMLMHYRGELL